MSRKMVLVLAFIVFVIFAHSLDDPSTTPAPVNPHKEECELNWQLRDPLYVTVSHSSYIKSCEEQFAP